MANKQKKHKKKQKEQTHSVVAGAATHTVGTHGRTFEGFVVKKFQTRVVVDFERTVYVKKYQRFYKKKTRLHARLPTTIHIEVGDYIRVQQCRPLSKIIHFVVVERIRSASEMTGQAAPSASIKVKETNKSKEAKG